MYLFYIVIEVKINMGIGNALFDMFMIDNVGVAQAHLLMNSIAKCMYTGIYMQHMTNRNKS